MRTCAGAISKVRGAVRSRPTTISTSFSVTSGMICRRLQSSQSIASTQAFETSSAVPAATAGTGTVGGGSAFFYSIAAALIAYPCWQLYDLATDFPEPCQIAVRRATACHLLTAQVGSTLGHSMFWDGVVRADRINVRIPISGDKGKAALYVQAVRSNYDAEWVLLLCEAHIEGTPGVPSTTTMIDCLSDSLIADAQIYKAAPVAEAPTAHASSN